MIFLDFIHEIRWQDLPEPVCEQATRCLLDTVGVAIGGRQTELSGIVYEYCAAAHGRRGASLWFDGREVSPPGAALGNGMTIDALDIHDGYTHAKGHAGAALIPAAVAILSLDPNSIVSGKELLTTIVVGYEIALRAGLALHVSACDYHTSGAWNALGCAAMTARRMRLTFEQTRHALGIAEYHGPRSQMMRCIDHPTMLKDGSGWGAMAGVSAGMMAGGGFTGAPAITVEAGDGDESVAEIWSDLGARWLILDQYFKPHAVCRWAQPGIAGALEIQHEHDLVLEDIKQIRVFGFHEAVRLATRNPENTEEAQYSLPFPVAAAIVHKQVGPAELSGNALNDPQVLDLSDRVELIEESAYNARFPAERVGRVEIETNEGQIYQSGEAAAEWGSEDPPSNSELRQKFRRLAESGFLLDPRISELEDMLWHCQGLADAAELQKVLAQPGV
jgi:2-methylcitrate dehydratase PrpD